MNGLGGYMMKLGPVNVVLRDAVNVKRIAVLPQLNMVYFLFV